MHRGRTKTAGEFGKEKKRVVERPLNKVLVARESHENLDQIRFDMIV